jgi:hypothetical protein
VPEILVDVLTTKGISQINAVIDSGASVNLIPSHISPAFTYIRTIFLKGFRAGGTVISAPYGEVSISIDGKDWITIEAAISDQATTALISPEQVPGYEFEISEEGLKVFKVKSKQQTL